MKIPKSNLNVQLLKIKDQEKLIDNINYQLFEVCFKTWKELVRDHGSVPNENDIRRWIDEMYPNFKLIDVDLSEADVNEYKVTFTIKKVLEHLELPELKEE